MNHNASPKERLLQAFIKSFPQIGGISVPIAELSESELWKWVSIKTKISELDLAQGLADSSGYKRATSLAAESTSLLRKIPFQIARSILVLPLNETPEAGIVIATRNPFNDETTQVINFLLGRSFQYAITPPDHLEAAITHEYMNLADSKNMKTGQIFLDTDGNSQDIGSSVNDKAIPSLAREIMLKAIALNASDIHFQPFFGSFAIRIRVDGILRRLTLLPGEVGDSIVRYFLGQSGMDPTNQLIPQDGRMSLMLGKSHYDLRISALPASGAVRLVVRLLNQNRLFQLDKAEFSIYALQKLHAFCSNSSGVILLTGPTGCGKTSTLYSMISELNQEGTNIITVENPVEYKLPGISQVEVNKKAGLTFASALRSILRQDPDIILIGEIRDEETARIAMQSALTGHLVLSTLHTNDAITAIPRLIDLGVSPSVLADALSGIVSQRLLRRLCEKCKEPVTLPLSREESLFKKVSRIKPGARAIGCNDCGYTGYSGRIPVTDIIEITPPIVQAIIAGATNLESLREACGTQFKPISTSAAKRIISGDTSASEAARVIGHHFWHEVASEYNQKIPDASQISLAIVDDNTLTPAILIFSINTGLAEAISGVATQSWFNPITVKSPEEANKALHKNIHICFVIVDIDDALDDDAAIQFIEDARVAMAWSRLPALLMIPEGKPWLEEKLIAAGATSLFLHKPATAVEIIGKVAAALEEQH